jgi:hypothetical protein
VAYKRFIYKKHKFQLNLMKIIKIGNIKIIVDFVLFICFINVCILNRTNNMIIITFYCGCHVIFRLHWTKKLTIIISKYFNKTQYKIIVSVLKSRINIFIVKEQRVLSQILLSSPIPIKLCNNSIILNCFVFMLYIFL